MQELALNLTSAFSGAPSPFLLVRAGSLVADFLLDDLSGARDSGFRGGQLADGDACPDGSSRGPRPEPRRDQAMASSPISVTRCIIRPLSAG